MKTKHLLFGVLISLLCGCNNINNSSQPLNSDSETKEELSTETFNVDFYIDYYGVCYKNVSRIALNGIWCRKCHDCLNEFKIDTASLILGEQLVFNAFLDEDAINFGLVTSMMWGNTCSIYGNVERIDIQKADVTVLKLHKEEDSFSFVGQENDELQYKLKKIYYYDYYNNKELNIAFANTDLSEYEELATLEEGTELYCTYIKADIKDNICELYGVYLFNPYEK